MLDSYSEENKLPTTYHDCLTMETSKSEGLKLLPLEELCNDISPIKRASSLQEEGTPGSFAIKEGGATAPHSSRSKASPAVTDNRFAWKDSAMEQIAARDKAQRDVWTAIADSYRSLLLENATLRAQLKSSLERPRLHQKDRRDWTRIESKADLIVAQMRAQRPFLNFLFLMTPRI
eukprot:Blabericola_migrator_1__8255@NODE_427_length_8589_cov_62_998123_g337_i0_p6_GENE_NODE_427_length_8589_cov_62_998123_g337_i0NODE_427_length_8589_cov_62_998123_g337_i0_p6_ORF_typecomplete_len176_score32_06_NODE_427_length_8589_cov_62_998123_g337_i066657192